MKDPASMTYPVMEHFMTLQGEGFWAGSAAYFIRLAGCDVGCFWCDVKESWEQTIHPMIPLTSLVQASQMYAADKIVVTGGEPLLHDLTPLCDAFGFARRHLETSGTQPLTGHFDWITFSPKKFKNPLPEFYEIAHELKVIIHNKHDLKWAESQADLCTSSPILYLQPDWYQAESANWIIEYILKHPHWRMSLQTHKYLNIP